ncbi:MAG: hypothetical protein OSJ62_02220 [Lachnospiraceae bacterium]|nr:hypothetical protein [Lachnospiraceae bacterium]
MKEKMRIVCFQIDNILEKHLTQPVLVAIDGMSASGKSTLGNLLKEKYQCNLFHMDDFFLRPEQRTKERLSEAGGNVDYKRFQEEILAHISDPSGLVYQRYNCSQKKLEEKIKVPYNRLNIVEGAYSQHPYFKNIYDLRFFLTISSEEQKRRIRIRNGEAQLERFIKEWIPMENQYFETYQIPSFSICL